jgi:F-type H+-transporting ATPase subunit alpha
MNGEHAALLKQVNETGDWNGDIEGQYKAAIEKFKSSNSW